MGSSKKVTVGYKYYLGLHFGLCHGPVDAVLNVSVGERDAWLGEQTASGTLAINAPELFGGDKREGGIVGTLDVLMGESTQVENTYLQAKIGALIPAFRGILSAVWRGGQVTSNNPYLKPWAFRVQRILQGWSGGAAWYPEKAIVNTLLVKSGSKQVWRYLVVENSDMTSYASPAYDDSSWNSGTGPFADEPWSLPGVYGFETVPATIVPEAKKVWLRTHINLASVPPTMQFQAFIDNDCKLYVNGNLVLTVGGHNGAYYDQAISTEHFVVGDNLIVAEGWDRHSGPGNWYWFDWRLEAESTIRHMNPAHIIYQCLTDTAWGMGYPTSALDNDSFTAAANALYSEEFGLSMLWNQQDSIESFIAIVMDHIGGILYVDPASGKFALKLLRADYDRNTLPQYSPINLIAAEGCQRQAWGETINEITVTYSDQLSGKELAVTVQDLANINMQGGVVSQTRSYSGIRQASLAQRVALRDLQASSTPLARIELRATRAAWSIFPGDVFRLSWPEYGIDDVVYRALEVNRGTLQNGEIIIMAVEDVFGLPDNTYLIDQPGGWVDPSNEPAPAPYRKMVEAPYWDLVRSLSAADMAYVDSLSGYLETAAVRPSGDATNYSLYAKVGAADYAEGGNGDFCPSAMVVGALTKTTTAITLTNGVDLDLVEVGGYAIIDAEYVLVNALDANALTATISRGLLDTVPDEHDSGARIFFADGYVGFSTTEYADGETVDVKLLPLTGQGELDISLAPVDSLTFDQRQYRPYPPGNVLTNSAAFPEWIDGGESLYVSWAHRDRLSQTAYLVEQSEASIGPEDGTTYNLRIYNENDVLVKTYSGLSGTEQSFPLGEEGGDGGEPLFNYNVLALHCGDQPDNGDAYQSSVVFQLRGDTLIDEATGLAVSAFGNAAVSTDQSKFGGSSLYFDGADDYLSMQSSVSFGFGTGDFTVECWIKTSSTNRSVWDNRTTTEPGTGYIAATTGRIGFWNNTTAFEGTSNVADNSWHHLVWCRYSGVLKLFVDGTSEYSGAMTSDLGSSRPLRVGRDYLNAGDFNGYIDDIRITKGVARYTANFTTPTTELPFILGTFYDVTKRNAPTFFGGATRSATQSKFGGYSLYFDGNGDYLQYAYNTDFDLSATDFTVECFFYRTANTGNSLYACLVSKRDSGLDWDYGLEFNSNALSFRYAGTGTLSAGTTTLNTWHHVAVVRKSGVIKTYLDGVFVASVTAAPYNRSVVMHVGRSLTSYSDNQFQGYIDELRITKFARYSANFTPPTSAFADYLGNPVLNGRLRYELEAVRGGLVSYQKHNHTVLREGYGFNYGYYYGGQ